MPRSSGCRCKASNWRGETTIGLVYLKHQMDRGGNPGVYLVPTVQLVEQVIEESKKIGFCVDA